MLSNLISNIKVGLIHKKLYISVKHTKSLILFINALWDEKLINGFCIEGEKIIVFLKYDYWNRTCIKKIKFFSKPGKRQYLTLIDYQKLYKYNIIFFVSTIKGVMTFKRAHKLGLGGELLFGIFL